MAGYDTDFVLWGLLQNTEKIVRQQPAKPYWARMQSRRDTASVNPSPANGKSLILLIAPRLSGSNVRILKPPLIATCWGPEKVRRLQQWFGSDQPRVL